MSLIQILLLALIQGAAELLPVSSSAHVITAEKLMGLDPSSPEMTFLLVMLHTGTMCAVLLYFWSRWRKWSVQFLKMSIVATGVTGVLGLALKETLEKAILPLWLHESQAEIEHLFKSLPLISFSLFCVGSLILYASAHEKRSNRERIGVKDAVWIGFVQGLCLPFRGFSRSGATISTGLIRGISRGLAEDFSFLLAVLLTPPVLLRELLRLLKHSAQSSLATHEVILPGLLGMVFSFLAGLGALKWLSAWLEHGKWKFFGYYCLMASAGILGIHYLGY